LCNNVVQFVIKQDNKAVFRFASLQSPFGLSVKEKFNLNHSNLNSFILVDEEKVFIQSTAALKVANYLGGYWRVSYALIIIPPFIRDSVYAIIAKNRYKWFGKKESCMIPTQNINDLFLDNSSNYL